MHADVYLFPSSRSRQAYALPGRRKRDRFCGHVMLEQRQMLRPADAGDQQVQVMEFRRVGLDKRTRKEVRLLLVVSFEGDGIAVFVQQRLQCLDHGSGFQNKFLHPGAMRAKRAAFFAL